MNASTTHAALECQSVHVALGRRTILRDVSLRVEPGEFVVLLGPNAAGKSTLVKTLAGLIAPASGRVGECETGSIAYLGQSEPLPTSFRVHEVVQLGRLPHRDWIASLAGSQSAADREAVRRAMEATQILDLAERPVEALSGGERQRVALARALAQEPRVIVLDEPLTHLDIRFQMQVLRTIRAVVEEGVAALMVLHDLSLATYADRCVMLGEGNIVGDGPPREILNPELLERVFGVPFRVEESEGRLHVLALPPRSR